MKAWYFAKPDGRLAYGDNREINLGETHTVDYTPKICERGLHGSIRLINALIYASSSILYRVEIEGEISVGDDKIAGKSRTYLERFDCENVLMEFARKQALINIENIKPYCSEEEYSVVVEYLETGSKELISAAYSAARSAAAAARSAAAAARSAATWAADADAYSAARSATWAADAAACSAARSATWASAAAAAAAADADAADATLAAAYSAANKMLEEMILA